MGSEGPKSVIIHVTGFKKFNVFATNPTETLVSNLQSYVEKTGLPPGASLGSCTVLETAGDGALPALQKLLESSVSSENKSSSKEVVWAQLYSDHYQNNNNNITLGLPQDYWPFISASSGFEHQQDPRFLDPQKMMNSASDYHNNLVSSSSSSSSSRRCNGFQVFSSELERQRLEMDCFLHFQNERLKAVLTEETRKKEIMMMQNYESKMKFIIDAKDEALNTAKTRTKELQNYLSMAETEAENWEKKATETEIMMIELNSKLKQARARTHEDAESVCNGGGGGGDDVDEKERQKKMVCKVCHVRSSCILLLPCRHLCCCMSCEGLLMFCPVCETVKNRSMEVFFGLN